MDVGAILSDRLTGLWRRDDHIVYLGSLVKFDGMQKHERPRVVVVTRWFSPRETTGLDLLSLYAVPWQGSRVVHRLFAS